MSERLTPQQQREMRVRMGSEVQGLSESVSGGLPRDPDSLPLHQQVYTPLPSEVAIQFAEKFFKDWGNVPIVQTEDRLRGAIVEACTWLQQGAPGCALQVLENALKL